METALAISGMILSAVSLGLTLFRRHKFRSLELRNIGELSLDTAAGQNHKEIGIARAALETALLIDMKDGKQDFTREQLWAAVEGAMARRGIRP